MDHVLGVAGTGMLPLALLLAEAGHAVSGADRGLDRDPADARRRALLDGGVRLMPEDAPPPSGARVIISSAIEPTHPALAGGVLSCHRAVALRELLDELHPDRTILVAGSSGKTTTTAMIGWILATCGRDPLVYVGGEVRKLAPHGARFGKGPAVVEVDESDGSIARFTADVAVVTSVSEDHKPLAEIEALFRAFLEPARARVVSPAAFHLASAGSVSSPVFARPLSCSPLLGTFNRQNEALAITAVGCIGVNEADAVAALASFPGVARRLEMIRGGRIMVIDDFAHNPEKLAASLAALKGLNRRLLVLFQPHGYGPTRMHARNFGAAFTVLQPADRLVLLPIYDAGGTADRTIDASIILENAPGVIGALVPDRAASLSHVRSFASSPGDAVIAVMGARDPGLAAYARKVSETVSETAIDNEESNFVQS